MTPVPDQWYVQFDGLSYGPYTHAQMQGFTAEGRVIAGSLITTDPARGYFQAQAFPIFAQWSSGAAQAALQPAQHPAIGQTSHMQVREQQPVQVAMGQSSGQPSGQAYGGATLQAPSATVLLVMAEIRSAQGMPFLQTLQTHGPAQRIGDTVWLLRSAVSADALRESLSRTLSKQDRLFILDSFHNKTAWFNIGADMDQRIRELWNTAD